MTRAFSRSQPSIWRRQQDWPFEPSGHYFLARAAQILCPDANEGLQDKAAAPMRRQLADGELRAVALLGNGTLAPVRSDAWVVDENFSQWFSACQITNFALFGSGIHPLAGVTYHWLFVDRAGLDSIVGSARIAPGIEAFPADRGLRGRRPAYDWPAFDAEATSKLEEEGAFNPAVDANWNKAALERHMQEWCAKNWGKEPGESTIRDKLTKVEADFVAGRKSQ